MKGDINCHTTNRKFRDGYDCINWDSGEDDSLVENAGYFVLENDFCSGTNKKKVDMDKNNFQIP